MSYGDRPHLEDALCLDLLRLLADRIIAPGSRNAGALTWYLVTWWGREPVATMQFRSDLAGQHGWLELEFTEEGQPACCELRLSTVPNYFGGVNWFIHCPETGRRARKLYKWPGWPIFCHREAIGTRPIYACQRESGLDRVQAKRRAVRRKLGEGYENLTRAPIKPKWMRWATFERIVSQDIRLKSQEALAMQEMMAKQFLVFTGLPPDLGSA